VATEQERLGGRAHKGGRGRAEGCEGHRRAALRADAGGDRKRDRPGDRRSGAPAADDSGPRLGGDEPESAATYTSATSISDALKALAAGARPIAGGTDLVVGARGGKAPLPESLVAIHAIDELRGISSSGGGLRMGALVTHAEIVADATVRDRLTALADASAIVGS